MGRKRGRPQSSRNILVTPEFRKEPDIEKLGRVLIAIAADMAGKEKELYPHTGARGEGDDMT